jgi:hypothetical protein
MIKKTDLKVSAVISDIEAEIKREVVKSSDSFSAYVNDVQVQMSPWDIRLVFGRVDEPATPNKPTVTIKQLGELHMSLELAKRLAMIVIEQLRAYEGRFGQIPMPKEKPDTKILRASTAPPPPSSQ